MKLPQITLADIERELYARRYYKVWYFWNTPEKRAGYDRQLEFLEATAYNRETCLMAANRVGKSETGAFAVSTWLTGDYPEWWKGRRWNRPVNVLVAGETGKLVRDSVQAKLLGKIGEIGTGLIPKENIMLCRPKAGIADAVDMVKVKHKSGGESLLQFMSYDQGRAAFQATERDVVWEDEEPPLDVHSENLIRTMTTNGLVIMTFTPLMGVSETVLSLHDKAAKGHACVLTATWDDAPHLTEEAKKQLFDSLPPYQRDARSKGVPQLGSGAIYQVPEHELTVDDFPIPQHWKRVYGMDVGWNNTAAVFAAHDMESDTVYIYADYKRGQCEPSVHADAIKARNVPVGVIDPASAGAGQDDGKRLIDQYRGLGLNLQFADNAVEAGIFAVYERMTTGRLKVFKSCTQLLQEIRLYRRDEKGRIVKQNDHCADALRYCVYSGLSVATYPPKEAERIAAEKKKNDPILALRRKKTTWAG